jgi:photosystem I subunit 11
MPPKQDARDREVVLPAGDPQVGNLATPVNASALSKAYINSLPAYRPGLLPHRRGLEIGMAHGYFLFGPFAWGNPLRHTAWGDVVALISTAVVVIVLTFGLSLYTTVGIQKPLATVTTPTPPEDFATQKGWIDFAAGFLVGGVGGGIFAFLVYQVVKLLVF